MEKNYLQKYIEYKKKYIELKQSGGGKEFKGTYYFDYDEKNKKFSHSS
jgi:hypothetical protein